MTTALHRASPTGRTRARFAATLLAAAAFAIALAVVPGSFTETASAAPVASQCNSVDNTPGLLIECDVTVENTLDMATGAASTTVTTRECHGVANTANPLCVTNVEISTGLTTSVDQCNYAVDGGGANVICNVTVTNRIVGEGSATPASVDQCNGSGAGGTAPTLLCDPDDATTTNATITQCNGSANGGGASERVICNVGTSTETNALVVTVNQCNNSANGGGSTVICSVSMSNVFAAAEDDSTPTPTNPGTPTAPTAPTNPGAPGTPENPATPANPSTPVTPDGSGTPPDRQSPNTPSTPKAGELASTGVDTLPPLLIGSLTLLIGAALLVVARQRRQASAV